MAGIIEARLAELGIELPDAPAPKANYMPYVVSGNLAFMSGQVTIWNGEMKYIGKVGADLTIEQGYDAARLIGSALAAVGGNVDETQAFRAALRQAKFESVRGAFRFGPNQHPVQDLYVREVFKDGEGNYTNRTVKKVFTDHADAYAKDCKM